MDASTTLSAFQAFGLLGLCGLATLEKFIPVAPSYVLLICLGASMQGVRALAAALVAVTIGSALGALGWYAIGRAMGARRVDRAVARYGRYVGLTGAFYARLVSAYLGNHFWVTLIGQTLPSVRIYLALPAGVFMLRLRPFVLATLIGATLWNAPFLGLGYLLRDRGDVVGVGFAVMVALVAVELSLLLVLRLRRRANARQGKRGTTAVLQPAHGTEIS